MFQEFDAIISGKTEMPSKVTQQRAPNSRIYVKCETPRQLTESAFVRPVISIHVSLSRVSVSRGRILIGEAPVGRVVRKRRGGGWRVTRRPPNVRHLRASLAELCPGCLAASI